MKVLVITEEHMNELPDEMLGEIKQLCKETGVAHMECPLKTENPMILENLRKMIKEDEYNLLIEFGKATTYLSKGAEESIRDQYKATIPPLVETIMARYQNFIQEFNKYLLGKIKVYDCIISVHGGSGPTSELISVHYDKERADKQIKNTIESQEKSILTSWWGLKKTVLHHYLMRPTDLGKSSGLLDELRERCTFAELIFSYPDGHTQADLIELGIAQMFPHSLDTETGRSTGFTGNPPEWADQNKDGMEAQLEALGWLIWNLKLTVLKK